jgi:hypothetical protein
LSDLRYDKIVLHKDSQRSTASVLRLRGQDLERCGIDPVQVGLLRQEGAEHKFNASRLLIPDDLPATVVLDATAKQNFL